MKFLWFLLGMFYFAACPMQCLLSDARRDEHRKAYDDGEREGLQRGIRRGESDVRHCASMCLIEWSAPDEHHELFTCVNGC